MLSNTQKRELRAFKRKAANPLHHYFGAQFFVSEVTERITALTIPMGSMMWVAFAFAMKEDPIKESGEWYAWDKMCNNQGVFIPRDVDVQFMINNMEEDLF